MQRFRDNILIMGSNGLIPYSGSSVAVYLAGTSTLASIYPNNDPAGAKENPFRAGDYGEIDFYAQNGRYDLLLTRQGYQSLRITDLQIWDPANSDFVTGVDVDGMIAGKADIAYVDQEVAGLIDDVTPAEDKTYSSQKVSTDLAAKVNTVDLADDTDPENGAGQVGSILDATGAVGHTQALINSATPSLWQFMTEAEISDSQTGTPTLDTSDAWNALFNAYRDCEVLIPRGTYKAASVEVFRKGHFPVAGGFTINAKGAVLVGDGEFIFNSCKRVTLIGLDAPETSMKLRGCWWSTFTDNRFHEIVDGDEPGINFTANYWNNWYGGAYQRFVSHANATGGFNANSFYGVAWRGDAGQGFSKTVPNMLVFEGQQDVQDLNFFGGDVSYYSGGVYHIEEPVNEDISITFTGVYLDSHGIPPIDGVKRSIRLRDCHVAGKINFHGALKGALRGSQTVWGNEHTAGWQSYGAYNLIPNGDMGQPGVGVTGGGNGPMGSTGSPNASVSWEVESGWNYLRINQTNTEATAVRFRSIPLPFAGVYSTGLLIRRHTGGQGDIIIGVNAQYGAVNLTDEWQFVTMSANTEMPAGNVADLLLQGAGGAVFDVDVAYVAITPGTHPPMFVPPHPAAARSAAVTTTEVRLGNNLAQASRPIVTAGNNTPEGVVSAPIGSIFGRTNATVGGEAYVKASGGGTVNGWLPLELRRYGTTAERPTGLSAGHTGIEYFDTTLAKPIWWATSVWRDGNGTAV